MISLLMMVFLAQPAVADDPAYQVSFDGSVQYLSTGETGKVIVNVGPASPEGSYNYTVSASSGSVTPTSGSSSNESFTITVSAPSTAGDMVVTVTLSNGDVSTPAKYTIHVVDPVVISATVKNSGPLSLKDVPVQFFVDGTMVNATTFDIDANSSKTLTYRWTVSGLSDGEHTIKVVIDPEGKYQFLTFADGSREYTSKFYVGDSGWGLANLALTIVLVLLVLIFFITYAGRKNKNRKKR